MKTVFLFLCVLAAVAMQAEGQNDIVELKSGKNIETRITSHTENTVVTAKGTYAFKKIKRIRFFVKNYDDVEFYKALESAGIEIRFITTPH